jgi:chemotaxis protein CheZ
MSHGTAAIRDSEDLEELCDSISTNMREHKAFAAAAPSCNPCDMLINRIGYMARTLHDTLRKLGFDKNNQRTTALIPNAYDRLHYIAAITEQAADRIMNATEAAQPMVEKIETESLRLADEWQMLLDNRLDVDQFRHLVNQTRDFLVEVPRKTNTTNACLREILDAQGSRHTAGQLIKQIVDLTQQLEKQLLELLIANPPSSADSGMYAELLSLPTIKPEKRAQMASGHDQIDELLESLGF